MSIVRFAIDWYEIRFRLWKLWLRLTWRRACPKCFGYGAIERLDACYMKRFGLRQWDGCQACGGYFEKVGTGIAGTPAYVPPPIDEENYAGM